MMDRRRFAALLVLASLVPWASPAFADCLTAAAARQGFVLTSSDGRNRLEIQPSGDDMVSYKMFIGGKLASMPTYYQGFYLARVDYENGTSVTPTYDFDYMKEPVPDVGYHKAFRLTLQQPNGQSVTLAVDNRIVGHESIAIGDCSLDTLVIEGQTTNANGAIQKRRTNFSPLLRMYLRMTMTNADAPPATIAYDRIEPLSR